MSLAILFPGQGSQHVGMGAELFDARPDLLGDPADEVLGWSLRDMCLAGPLERLTATEHAQPALYALAAALWEELSARLSASPAAAAGHSLGEYTALTAARYTSFESGLRLVAARGRAMAAAAAVEESGMAALLGVDAEGAETIAAARRDQGGRLWVANINGPGQVVVAGGAADLSWLADHARELGARRVVPLTVAGAFHSPYMDPAVPAVAAALAEVVFTEPRFPVWANTTAAPLRAADAPLVLASQVVSPVRFADALEGMAAAGVTVFVHVGPGDVTAGMARRATTGTAVLVASELSDLDEVAAAVDAAIQ